MHSLTVEQIRPMTLRLLFIGLLCSRAVALVAQPGVAIHTIPVVVHILHQNGNENISDAQVLDGIAKLNAHYDEPTVALLAPFDTIAADMDIAFVLASTAPDGSPTTGIERIETPLTESGGTPESFLNAWPRNRYLNIWVVRSLVTTNMAYISTLPEQADPEACTDGVMIYHSYVGSIGTASIVTQRTLTQAVGRFLGLKWLHEDPIDGGPCGDDEVADTPICPLISFCNSENSQCSTLPANIENFMMFSYCQKMFTQGQRERVHAILNSPIAQRNELVGAATTSDPDCGSVGIAPSAMHFDGIRASPNPFADNITLTGAEGPNRIKLMDLHGKVITTYASATGTRSLAVDASLAAGCYVLHVEEAQRSSSIRVMKAP